MRKRLVLSILLLVVGFRLLACENGDCEGLLKKAADKVRSLRLIATERNFSTTCRVNVTADDGQVSREKMEFGSSKEKYMYKTSRIDMYQDAKTMVVIRRDEKMIFLMRASAAGKNEQDQYAGMVKLLDSLQRYLVFQTCTREFGTVHPGKGYTRMLFNPGDKLKRSGLKNVIYWLDADELIVRKILVNYTAGSGYGVQSYEMIVDAMNASPSTDPFKGSALEKVMRGGKLRSEFEGYRLVDKRK